RRPVGDRPPARGLRRAGRSGGHHHPRARDAHAHPGGVGAERRVRPAVTVSPRTGAAAGDPAHDRFVTVNGVALHYVDWGGPPGRPLLFVHGGSAHARWWDFTVAH